MVFLLVAKEAFEIFQDIRGTIGMYMFIIEESIQTAGMGVFMLQKAGLYERAKQHAEWIEINLANQLKDVATNPLGYVAYPLNLAYEAFADASLKNIEEVKIALDTLKQQQASL